MRSREKILVAALRAFGRLGLLGRPSAGVPFDGFSFEWVFRGQLTLHRIRSFEMSWTFAFSMMSRSPTTAS